MKHKSLIAFLVLVTLLSGSYVAVMKLAGQAGRYLAQAYMLIPALSALITRVFFSEQMILIVPMVIGTICTFTYLAYVYVKTRSVFVTAFAHIVMNNASASFSYLFVLRSQFLGNLGTVLVMVIVVALLYATGQLRIFKTLIPDRESVAES